MFLRGEVICDWLCQHILRAGWMRHTAMIPRPSTPPLCTLSMSLWRAAACAWDTHGPTSHGGPVLTRRPTRPRFYDHALTSWPTVRSVHFCNQAILVFGSPGGQSCSPCGRVYATAARWPLAWTLQSHLSALWSSSNTEVKDWEDNGWSDNAVNKKWPCFSNGHSCSRLTVASLSWYTNEYGECFVNGNSY